jgi:signal transduction histidine kinase
MKVKNSPLTSDKLEDFIGSVLAIHRRNLREDKNPIASDPVISEEFCNQAIGITTNFAEDLRFDMPTVDYGEILQTERLVEVCLARGVSPYELVKASAGLLDAILESLEILDSNSGAPLASVRALQRALARTYIVVASYDRARSAIAHDLRAADRRRVAREIHDRLGNGIALGIRYLDMVELLGRAELPEAMEDITRTRDLLQEMLDVTRSIVSDARRTIPSRDLERELRLFAESFRTASPIIEIDVSGDEAATCPARKDEFFIILREALCNALTHARAQRIVVRADFSESRIRGVVEDDGTGFDPLSDEIAAGRRQGLRSIRERADASGGEAEISSETGHGTRVMVTLPVQAKACTG